jgi:LuxR family maltose regulon positive regulatory protein
LINHLSTLSDDFVLILDDYQFIHSAEVHNTLAALLERMPRCLHLVISTRSDPPLPLARLRARDQLVEIRAADLRFSGEESHGFLNQVMSLGLSGEDISALETRTEGWIAGLQMAALAIRTMPVPALRGPAGGSVSEFIHAFSGSNRYILDYLGEEVLSRRSASTQQFLLETSILGRLSGPLCDAVTGLKGTQETLLELEKENLFLIPLDSERQWYRYHHLFAELLRYQLEKTASTGDESMGGNRPGTGELHRRAAEWFQENQAAGEAISHYFAAGLQEQAASLIETQSEHMVFVTGQVYTLLEWLNNLSPEIYKTKPNLYFARMMAFITHSEYAAAGEVVEAVTQAAREMPEAEAAMEGKIALARGLLAQLSSRDTCGMREQALQAWEKLPPGNSMLRGLAAYLLGASHYWEGDPASAEPYYQQAIQLSRQAGNSFTTLVTVVDTCNVLREQGRYRRAYQLIAETQEELVRHGRAGHPMLGQLIINQGQILLQWNRLEEAERSLMRGMELINQDVPAEVLIFALISMAYLKLARGEQEEALGYAESCWQRTEDTSLTSVVARANLVRFWIYTGRVERVEEWLAASNLSPDDPISYLREREYMALAVVLLWQHKTDAALTVINRLVDLTGRSGRNGRRLYILALKALALQQSGDTEGSLACMGETLAAAQVEGYMRIYLDEGKPMENLLRLGLSRAAWRGTPFEAFVRSLLLAFQKQAGQDRPSALDAPLKTQQSAGLVEPLSSRELEVLTLSASGLSNMQVAAKLYLSEGTIKTHLHNIYGKLGVDNRIRAIQMARELGILV